MSSRAEQIMAYVEKMTDKERRELLKYLQQRREAENEPEENELPEEGATLVRECMARLLHFTSKHKRTVFAYEDAALTYGSYKPFDPCKVSAFHRKLPEGEPWGFFIGGMDSPRAVDGENARTAALALGLSFSPSVLAHAYLMASHEDAAGVSNMMPDFLIPPEAMPELGVED